MTHYPENKFQSELSELEDEGLTRRLQALPEVGGKVAIDGREYLNFSSNDYLNLASDDRLKEAAKAAVDRYGCGSTASRLMAGDLTLHEELEARLAHLVGMESALVFPSGFQANLGMVTTLAGRSGAVFSDELNHASLVDGCRLADAQVHIFPHLDTDALGRKLAVTQCSGRKVVVSDSMFSMDGDVSDVRTLDRLAREHGALLAIDEAHGLGVLGEGAGLCREMGVRPDVIVGTLTKSLGSGGGFVAGPQDFITLLVNKARSFIFSTGLAPACVGSALRAIDIIESEPGLGAELLRRADLLRGLLREKGFDVPKDRSQIIPLVIGSNQAAVEISRALYERGLLVVAVRPPSVPEGTARLRVSVTLAHTDDDLHRAADIFADVALEAGVL